MSYPKPSEKHEDGSATWQVHPFTITALRADDHGGPTIVLDDQPIVPQVAAELAQALHTATLHAMQTTRGLNDT